MPNDPIDQILKNSFSSGKDSGGIPGVLVDGGFWYWQTVIDKIRIEYQRSLRKLRVVQGYFALVVMIGLLAVFVLQVIFEYQDAVLSVDFWLTPNWSVGLLCLAILSGLFVIYRRASDKRQIHPLTEIGKISAPELHTIASPAAVERRFNIAHTLNDDAWMAVEEAYKLAYQAQHAQVTALHLFIGTFSTSPVQILFARLGLSLESIKAPLRRKLGTLPTGTTMLAAPAHSVFAQTLQLALTQHRKSISPLEIFAAAFAAEPFLAEVMLAQGIEPEELDNAIAWLRISEDLHERYLAFRRAAAYKPTKNMNRSMTAVATPFLDSVSYDLTRAAVYGQTGMLIGRESEMATILRAIEGGDQSVVLVGEPGVGKEALIDGLAELMVEERVPKVLQDKRLLKLSVPHIVSADGGTGAEERFLFALNQVARAGNVIIVIENIHELIGRGLGIDLASVLASELSRGYTFVIATTTPQAYTEVVERSVIAPKLQKIPINEPTRSEAIRVLEAQAGMIEHKHKVIFTYAALAAAVDLTGRYVHDGAWPEKAIEIMKETALQVSKRGQAHAWVKKQDVAGLITERTRIPITEVTQTEGEKLLHLEDRLHQRVIGQEPAVKAVAAALRRARTEMRSSGRPIANFMFLGPTGVGKTELAKATAEVYFGNEQIMVRFDMSEYQDQASVARLIGGNGQSGLMTEAIRKQPFCLLLLDELEKAHPDILNLYLQVMDDGRLTDGLGRTVDFTNVILIATSNAGTAFIQDQMAKGTPLTTIKEELMETELRQNYRPEFLNRFDDVIVFAPLTREDVVAIGYLLIEKVVERLKAKGIKLVVTDAAIHDLAEQGYDPKFGARPLRRVLQDKVENPIADFLLTGQAVRRDTVIFDAGGQIHVEKAAEL
jgi:ATP-dependent Clp protease ATP-binding subunit ClpC